MARDDEDIEQDNEGEEKPKKKGKILKILLIVLSVLLLIGGSVGTTMYLTGALPMGDESSDAADTKNSKKDKKDKKKKGEKMPAQYLELSPAFVVNFIENNQIRYLQITIEVMARDPLMLEEVKNHNAVIRNNLVFLFSNQTYDTISTVAGKQKLRDEALAEIQEIMKEETGSPVVEALYFTSFVMQ